MSSAATQATAAVQSAVDVSSSAALITTVNTTLSRWKTINSVCAVKGPDVPMDALHSHRQPDELGAPTARQMVQSGDFAACRCPVSCSSTSSHDPRLAELTCNC